MSTKTVLGELELPLAQCIDVEDAQGLVRHAVPGLDGDYFQRTGRRAARVAVTGVVTGPEAREGLEALRDRLRGAQPVDFVADVATATRVTRVLVERLDVRELAGRPERFEYAFVLREFVPPPPPVTEVPPDVPGRTDPTTGTLVVEVTVEGEPDFDMGRVTVTADGTGPAGPVSRTLTERDGNRWTESASPPGEHTVRAAVADPEMTGATTATVRGGQTTRVQITLVPSQAVARAFVVSFRFDSAFVEPCMRAALRRAAAYAGAHPSQRLLVVGHTDKTGSDPYNQSLSERRARAVFASLTFQETPTAAVDEWTAIRQPRTGDPVRTLQDRWGPREYQQMLQQLGFYPGRISGVHDTLTGQAVRAFRCKKGLPPGTTMDDAVWAALIRDYLADSPPAIARAQLLPNCAATKLEWLGCGEQDPVNNTTAAHRPNRRVELLFTTAPALPCPVPIPDTWRLGPPPQHTDAEWCLGQGADPARRGCFAKREPPPEPPRWLIQPAEPGTVNAAGRILKEVERADGTVEQVPADGESFVLITASGEFRAGEAPSGLPTPARAGSDGSFTFPGKPRGLYVLEVQRGVVARLLDAPDAPALGPTVCRPLTADGDRLEVLILRDPMLREIRLPVIVHLMTALHPTTRDVRTCTDAAVTPPVVFAQRTVRDEAAVRGLLREANRIWGRARVRFELRETLREAFATVGRNACAVTEDERNTIIVDSATPNAVNLYFFANVEATGEAGVHVVGFLQDGAGTRVRPIEAIAIGDRVQLQLIQNFPPIQRVPTVPEQEVIVAHELGHYLTLDHELGSETAARNRNRLMLPHEEAENRRLIDDEVTRARGSDNASKDCVPLSLRVIGATRYGGATGHRFVAIRDATAPPVVVDAILPAHLPASGLTLTGGDPGAAPTQRLVPRTGLGRREVIARFVPTGGGTPLETYAAVQLVDFDVAVDGATRTGGPTGTTFVAVRNATGRVVVRANLTPAPDVIPSDLATFSAGDETDDPLRRALPLSATGSTTVNVTVAGVTKTVTIVVSELALNVTGARQTAPGRFAAVREDAGDVTVEATFTPPVPESPDLVSWTGGQPGAGPRFRIVSRQAVGVTTVEARVGSTPPPPAAPAVPAAPAGPGDAADAGDGGDAKSAIITVFDFTLDVPGATRLGGPTGTQFVTRPNSSPLNVVATITPPGILPGVVTWTGATEIPGMQPPTAMVRRTSKGTVTVSAEMATVTRTITLLVMDVTLEVTGATRVTPGGTDFLAVVDAAANVQVRAVVDPLPTPVPADLVTWASSDNSATDDGPLQRLVPRTPKREVTVTATVDGQAQSVRIFVSELTLAVTGAAEIPPAGSGEFIVLSAAGQSATVTAVLDPAPSPVPDGLVTFAGDPTTPDGPTARRIPLDTARAVRVDATVAGVTRTMRVDVVTFTLEVRDATAVPADGTTFFALQQAGADVTVEAKVTPQPVAALPADFVAWTGSTPVPGTPLQSTVTRANTGVTPVQATSALLGGATRSVTLHVLSLRLDVLGASLLGPAGGNHFGTVTDPALTATVTAVLDPAPSPVPAGLVVWSGDPTTEATPLQRTVSRATARPVTVTATVAGQAQSVVIEVMAFSLRATPAVDSTTAPGTQAFAQADAATPLRVDAVLAPAPSDAVPAGFIAFSAGDPVADNPLRVTFPRPAPGVIDVTGTILGVIRTLHLTLVQVEAVAAPTAAAPPLTFVRVGLWDNAFDASNVLTPRNALAEAAHFVGADTRRFHFRVGDPSATGAEVPIDWRTRFPGGVNDDPGAAGGSPSLTLPQVTGSAGVFASRAVMLVSDAVDKAQATDSGLAPPHPEAGARAAGASNHRLRRITVDAAHPLTSEIFAEYTPAGAAGPVATVQLPVFERATEERRRLRVHLVNVRTASAATGGTGVLLGPRRDQAMDTFRSIYARAGVFVELNEILMDPPASCVGWPIRFPADPIALDPSVAGPTGDGLGNVVPSTEMSDLIAAVKLLPGFDANDIHVIYVARIYGVPLPTPPALLGGGLGGQAFADNFTTVASGARGFAFVAVRANITQFADVHEVTHITTDLSGTIAGGHFDLGAAAAASPGPVDGRNLMHRFFLVNSQGVANPKRMWNTQFTNTAQTPNFVIPAQIDAIRGTTASPNRFIRPY